MAEEQILTKLEEQSREFEHINKRLTNLEVGQNKLEIGQDKIIKTQDEIIKTVVEHSGMMGNFVTKDEFHKFREEMLNGQDTMITILKRLDEERVFTQKWIRDIEIKVEENTKEIQRVKLELKIA